MASQGQEVEIKLPVTHDQFVRLQDSLAEQFGEPAVSLQSDAYYSPTVDSYVKHPYPFKWLSVRERGNRVSINFKHFHPEGAEWHTHADEVDLDVSSAREADRLLKALGFELLIAVRKTRYTSTDPDGFEIALDDVQGLGHFVEIEATRTFGTIGATRQAVEDRAASLGLDPRSADARGYPFRLLQRTRDGAGTST